MGSPFMCFIRIDDNKFDIVVNDCLSSETRSFADIYDKIIQISSLVFNNAITSATHVFEIVNPFSNQTSILLSFDYQIRHLSIINLRPKAQTLRPSCLAVDDSDVLFLKDEKRNVFAFHLMVKSIEKDWNFKTAFASDYWNAVSQKLTTMNKNFSGYSSKVCEMTFKEIALFYVKTYDKLNLKLDAESQKLFDLLKSVHTLNADHLFGTPLSSNLKAIALKPEIRDYFKYGFNVDLKTVGPAKQSIAVIPQTLIPNTQTTQPMQQIPIPNDANYRTLVNSDEEIKVFHVIVSSIQNEWNFKKKPERKWKIVLQEVIKKYPSSRSEYSAKQCEEEFKRWVDFYIKTYHNFNNKLKPDLQERYDLLKVVHRLDARRMFGESSLVTKALEQIKSSCKAGPNATNVRPLAARLGQRSEPKSTKSQSNKSQSTKTQSTKTLSTKTLSTKTQSTKTQSTKTLSLETLPIKTRSTKTLPIKTLSLKTLPIKTRSTKSQLNISQPTYKVYPREHEWV